MSVMLTEKRAQGDAGYFRIGDVVLSIPPDSIQVGRLSNNEELTALRAAFPFYKKTGHERLDAVITWKAIVDNSSGTPDYSQWEDLRRIVAFFKVAPFVQVENAHLRQLILANSPDQQEYDRMAFALRQLRLETLPDIVDGIEATLTMTYFNYRPYSTEFGYKGPGEAAVDAHESPEFKRFIDNWIATNLNRSDTPDWRTLDAEQLRLSWREYLAVPMAQASEAPVPTIGPAPDSTSPAVTDTKPQSILSYAANLAHKLHMDFNIVQYQIQQESGGKQSAVSEKGARGIMQLMPGAVTDVAQWAQRGLWGTDPSLKDVTYEQVVKDPYLNVAVGMYYLHGMLQMFDGDYSKALAAYNAGPTVVKAGGYYVNRQFIPGLPKETRDYVKNIMGMANRPISSSIQSLISAQPATVPEPVVDHATLARDWLIDGYTLDHSTERVAFWFTEHSLDCTEENLYPMQFSVVFVNTLAPIPCSASTLPTYQHVGSPGSMVSITLLENGQQANPEAEPIYEGSQRLNSAVVMLDEQFHTLRNEWRAASSIHAMQALFVRNRFLNMLGITSILPSQLFTETVPDAPAVLQVQLLGSQYENTYEQLNAFRVKGISRTQQEAWEQILDSNILYQDLDDKKRSVYKDILQFKQNRDELNKAAVLDFIRNHRTAQLQIPFTFDVDESLLVDLRAIMDIVLQKSVKAGWLLPVGDVFHDEQTVPEIRFGEKYPEVNERINAGQLYWDDYLLITNDPLVKDRPEVKQLVETVNSKLKGSEADLIKQAYSEMFRWNYLNKSSFNTALLSLENQNPKIKAIFQNLKLANGPGRDSANSGHGTYRDLGLQLTLAALDNNPGYYFMNDRENMRAALASRVSVMADQVKQTTNNYKGFLKPSDPETSAIKLKPSDPELVGDFAKEALMRAHVPPQSMARAFPGFKVFFMEEDNSGIFHCYDDFYSYNAILGVEVIRYQDKPDTARILIANSTNILTHRLFDNSVWGKVEQRDYGDTVQITPTNTAGGPTVRGEGGPVYTVTKETAGHVNLTRGFVDANGRTVDVPNQYFALQPGTKIQIRIGYTNDPDQLWPVFTGMVTEVEEGEVMTVIAQSYMIELLSNFNTSFESVTGKYGSGPVWGWWREPGDAESLIVKMLEVSRANHFGKWQVRRGKAGTLARGFYHDQLNEIWSSVGSTIRNTSQVGRKLSFFMSTLSNGYNRAPQNIRINRFFDAKGNVLEKTTRPWSHESRTYLPWERPPYTIPDDPEHLSPWQVMKDIARRYPENILSVKQFGYPYQADATLVFADPNDWYIARFALDSEGEFGRYTPVDDKTFIDWWNSGKGKEQVTKLLTEIITLEPAVLGGSMQKYLAQVERDRRQGFTAMMEELYIQLNVLAGNYIAGDDMTFLQKVAALIHSITNADILGGQYRKRNLKHVATMLETVWINYEVWLRKQRSGDQLMFAPGERFQPVRRWHLVTSEFIIHNGMTLNENIANAVKIRNETFAASEHIPKELLRVLDVTNLIINPRDNCDSLFLQELYAQSFLKEEIGKMYRGELMLAGIPEIEPYDVIILHDAHRDIYGPIEVESVIHEFSQEYGYITIVRPRALVLVNEVMGAGICQALGDFLWGEWGLGKAGYIQEFWGLVNRMQQSRDEDKVVAGALSTSVAAGAMMQKAAIRAGGRILATKAGTGVAGTVAGAAASSWLAIALTATLGAWKSYVWAVKRQRANPLFLVPLTQFERPWVAGIQGWELSDLAGIFMNNFQRMVDLEIVSTIEGFKRAYRLDEVH